MSYLVVFSDLFFEGAILILVLSNSIRTLVKRFEKKTAIMLYIYTALETTRPPGLREASSIDISRKIFEISRKIFEISRYNITNKTAYYFF